MPLNKETKPNQNYSHGDTPAKASEDTRFSKLLFRICPYLF